MHSEDIYIVVLHIMLLKEYMHSSLTMLIDPFQGHVQYVISLVEIKLRIGLNSPVSEDQSQHSQENEHSDCVE